jgi:hypothetical protein
MNILKLFAILSNFFLIHADNFKFKQKFVNLLEHTLEQPINLIESLTENSSDEHSLEDVYVYYYYGYEYE